MPILMAIWWQGKGYWTFIILFATAIVAGIILQAATIIDDSPWYWAVALLVAAAVNWQTGCRYNALKRASKKYAPRRLLTYPARHRAMSLPMEAWSPVMAIIAFGLIGYDLIL